MKSMIFWEGPGWYVEVDDDGCRVWFQFSDTEGVEPEGETCFWWDKLPEWSEDTVVVFCQ